MKFDIVSWVKDGEWCLPCTLKRLEDVLPSEFVHRKIMVDDHSVDGTKKIGEFYGWEVYDNPSHGISAGANFALSKVDCPFFMSFEQDVYLAKDWFGKISNLIEKADCVAVSGVRLANQPHYLKLFEMFLLEREQHSENNSFWFSKSLDNTLFITEAIRNLGGFPITRTSTGVDTILAHILSESGFRWLVDYSVISVHLRKNGVRDAIKHQFWYAFGAKEIKAKVKEKTGLTISASFVGYLVKLGFSPFRGLQIGFKQKDPRICALYPLMRLASCLGYLKGV